MQVQLPIFILCLLLHAGIYLTSDQSDRRIRLLACLALMFNTVPIWYGGYYLEASAVTFYKLLGLVMVNAPYYFPLLSFLVYIRGKR